MENALPPAPPDNELVVTPLARQILVTAISILWTGTGIESEKFAILERLFGNFFKMPTITINGEPLLLETRPEAVIGIISSGFEEISIFGTIKSNEGVFAETFGILEKVKADTKNLTLTGNHSRIPIQVTASLMNNEAGQAILKKLANSNLGVNPLQSKVDSTTKSIFTETPRLDSVVSPATVSLKMERPASNNTRKTGNYIDVCEQMLEAKDNGCSAIKSLAKKFEISEKTALSYLSMEGLSPRFYEFTSFASSQKSRLGLVFAATLARSNEKIQKLIAVEIERLPAINRVGVLRQLIKILWPKSVPSVGTLGRGETEKHWAQKIAGTISAANEQGEPDLNLHQVRSGVFEGMETFLDVSRKIASELETLSARGGNRGELSARYGCSDTFIRKYLYLGTLNEGFGRFCHMRGYATDIRLSFNHAYVLAGLKPDVQKKILDRIEGLDQRDACLGLKELGYLLNPKLLPDLRGLKLRGKFSKLALELEALVVQIPIIRRNISFVASSPVIQDN